MNKMMSTIVSLAIMVMSLLSLPQNAYADYGFSASTKSDYGFNGTTQTGHGFVQASAPSAASDVLNNTVVSTSYYPNNYHYNPGNYYPGMWYPTSTYPVNNYPYHYNQYKGYAPTANIYCPHCRSTHQYGVHAPSAYNQPPCNIPFYGNAGPRR
jgi:hypothetical protein